MFVVCPLMTGIISGRSTHKNNKVNGLFYKIERQIVFVHIILSLSISINSLYFSVDRQKRTCLHKKIYTFLLTNQLIKDFDGHFAMEVSLIFLRNMAMNSNFWSIIFLRFSLSRKLDSTLWWLVLSANDRMKCRCLSGNSKPRN